MKKTYKVTCHRRVLEHEPGETFEAAIPPDQERFLLDGGFLSVVPNKPSQVGKGVTQHGEDSPNGRFSDGQRG